MPKASERSRNGAQWVVQNSAGLGTFLTLANLWRLPTKGQPDTESKALGLAAAAVAAEAVEASMAGRPPRGTSTALATMEALRTASAERLERNHADQFAALTLEISSFAVLFFYRAWEGWRLMRACETCGDYFTIGSGERARKFCRKSHQSSRSTTATGHRVSRHRTSKRVTT